MPLAQGKIVIAPGFIKPANSDSIPKGPMTSKQVKKSYKERNAGPKMTKAEQRKMEQQDKENIRKELEREKRLERERIKREKKKEKEEEEKRERKRNKVPEKSRWVRPSQGRITGFVVLGKQQMDEDEEDHEDDNEGADPVEMHPQGYYDGADGEELDMEAQNDSDTTVKARKPEKAAQMPAVRPQMKPVISDAAATNRQDKKHTSRSHGEEDEKVETDTIDKSFVSIRAVSRAGKTSKEGEAEPLPPAPPQSSIDYFAQIDADDEPDNIHQIQPEATVSREKTMDCQCRIYRNDARINCHTCKRLGHFNCPKNVIHYQKDANSAGNWLCDECAEKAGLPRRFLCEYCGQVSDDRNVPYQEFRTCESRSGCKVAIHRSCARNAHAVGDEPWFCKWCDESERAFIIQGKERKKSAEKTLPKAAKAPAAIPTASPDYFAELDGLSSSYDNAPITPAAPTSLARSLPPPATPRSILKQPSQALPTDRPALKELTPSASNARRVAFSPATKSVSIDDRHAANVGKKRMGPPETPSKVSTGVAPEILSYLEQYADDFPTSSQLARELMEDENVQPRKEKNRKTVPSQELPVLGLPKTAVKAPEKLVSPAVQPISLKRKLEASTPSPALPTTSSAPSTKKRGRFFQERPSDLERAVLYESQLQAKKDEEMRALRAQNELKLQQLLAYPAASQELMSRIQTQAKAQPSPGKRISELKSKTEDDEFDFGSDEIGADDLADVTLDDILAGCT